MSRVHHLALGARNLEELARFYVEFFGLREVTRHADANGSLRSIWLDAEGTLLMLEQARAARPDGAADHGVFLIAFAVSVTRRGELERSLRERGYVIDARTEFTSYTRDAEGNRVAFSHYPETP